MHFRPEFARNSRCAARSGDLLSGIHL